MNDSITIQIGLRITKEQINDLMACALEGGINYWASSAKPQQPWGVVSKKGVEFTSECISNDFNVMILEQDEDTPKCLSLEKFTNGVKKYFENNPQASLDLSDFDAEVADQIIQYALFDEIVYG